MAVRGHYDNDMYVWAIIIRRFCDTSRIGCKTKLSSFYDRTAHVRGSIYRAPVFIFYIK
jgi:hypothetical protein